MNRLNYNHLYYFYIIAKEGSIKLASEKLHVTQPTLSDQLRLLEEHFGRKLFERRNRQLFLTKYGERALEACNRIFALGNELERTMRSEGALPEQSIRVGIEPSLSRSFTYRLLVPIFEMKQIQIKIYESGLNHLYSELEAGNLDLIMTDNHDVTKDYARINVGTSKYFAVCGKKFADQAAHAPACLGHLPFFHYTRSTRIRYEIDHYFASHDIYPQVMGEADNLDFLRTVAEKNQCYAILPENFIRTAVKEKKLFILAEIKNLKTTVEAIFPEKTENEGTLAIIKVLRNKKLRSQVIPPPLK